VRGLIPASVDAMKLPREAAAARLRAAVRDPDRRVRTEALRTLAGYEDDESFAVVLAALDSPDTWLSVSAAEAMGRFATRKDAVVPKLTNAAGPGNPLALRITALTSWRKGRHRKPWHGSPARDRRRTPDRARRAPRRRPAATKSTNRSSSDGSYRTTTVRRSRA
jgi:hypothetical protein